MRKPRLMWWPEWQTWRVDLTPRPYNATTLMNWNAAHKFRNRLMELNQTRQIYDKPWPDTRTKQMPAPSKDRVRFTLHQRHLDQQSFKQVLVRALDVSNIELAKLQDQARAFGEVEIICRPSQFARFLIYREQAGFQNMFKELNAKLFVPAPPPIKAEPVDVSHIPANH